MPDFKVTGPDGRAYRVTAPEGASQAEIASVVQSQVPAKPSTALERFGTGAGDPIIGAAQIGARMPLAPSFSSDPATAALEAERAVPETRAEIEAAPGRADARVREREQAYQGSRKAAGSEGFDWARLFGNVTGTAPLAALPGGPALSGAAAASLQPVTEGDFGTEKLKQAAGGALFGKAAGAVGSAIAPTLGAAQKVLAAAGIKMTPGQLVGGIGKSLEDTATSIPILRDFINSARGQSVESFNTAALNQPLAFIGQKLTGAAKFGHDAIDEVRTKLGDAYDALLPRLKFKADAGLAADAREIAQRVREMPKPQADQLRTIVENRVMKRIDANGEMDGPTLKKVEGELTEIAKKYSGSSDGAQRELASVIDSVKAAIRENLARINPALRDELAKINMGYATFARLRAAATRRAGSEGVFTPGDLMQAVKAGDKSAGKGSFATGDALMQTFAEAANKVLPSKIPTSGTAERLAGMGLAGGASYFLHNPEILAGAGAAALPYTRLGMAALNAIASQEAGPVRQAIGAGVRRGAPLLSPEANRALNGE